MIKNESMPANIDFKGSVKKIIVKTLRIQRLSTKIDSIRATSEIYFSKNGKIQSVNHTDNYVKNLWRKIEFDALERITSISIDNGTETSDFVKQYYSGNSEFPDSTIINRGEKYKEKYINRFVNNLVTKQEHYVNDTLQDYRVYKYNEQNQLIEDLYLNPENESGETLVSSESHSGYKLSFYPERQTLYEHKKVKDTTIVVKISPKYSRREVTKKVQNKKFDLKIIEEYDRDFFKRSETTWTSKDSSSTAVYYFGPKKEIRDYYLTFRNSKKIIYKTKSSNYNQDQEKVSIYTIDNAYDKFKNWTKKVYFNEGVLDHMIERQIEYYSK
jgi:hypothetical protein